MEAGVDDLIGNELEIVRYPHSGRHELANVLVRHDVPDAVTRKDEKLVLVQEALLQIKL